MNKLQGSITRYQYQHEKKVVSDSPGLVDFAIWLVIFVTFLTCRWESAVFWQNSNHISIVINPANQKGFWG